MAELVLGPIVRSVGRSDAAVWVETDAACEVEVLGGRERTFHVEGHHYALVDVDGLTPGSEHRYEVRLDGRRVWPPEDTDLPPSGLRTWSPGRPFRLLVGSCHQAAPHREPWTLDAPAHKQSSGPDALHAWARRLKAGETEWPDALLLVGDQVYADQTHPETADAIAEHRGGPTRPGWPPVTSFQEYTWLYREAWSVPLMRWLLSNIPTMMIFDDHDVIDDWNISAAWRRQIEQVPWWSGRITGALMSYWLYQHLGNAPKLQREEDEVLQDIRAADDGSSVLRDFVQRADIGAPGSVVHRWSYQRDLGPCRLIVVDSRNGRVLDDSRRSMLDEPEWSWLESHLRGDVDHLLIASSLPWLLPRSIHDLEAWNEQVANGAWGRLAARAAEGVRQAIDLEHWAAFDTSFDRLSSLIRHVAAGERGGAPSTILALSGDVHFAYVAEPAFAGVQSRVRQIVSSPIRQAVPMSERRAQRLIVRPPFSTITRALAWLMPRAKPAFDWHVTDGPCFDNNIALLTFDGPDAHLQLHKAVLDDEGGPTLELVVDRPV